MVVITGGERVLFISPVYVSQLGKHISKSDWGLLYNHYTAATQYLLSPGKSSAKNSGGNGHFLLRGPHIGQVRGRVIIHLLSHVYVTLFIFIYNLLRFWGSFWSP